MALTIDELREGLKRLHNESASIMDLFNLQGTLYNELAKIEHDIRTLYMCHHKYHDQLPLMENMSDFTLTLDELCTELQRLRNGNVSVTGLFKLQNALLNEITIVNHALQSLRIGYQKHHSQHLTSEEESED